VTDYGAREERTDRFSAFEDRFAGYTVNDQNGEKIGKVDDLFVDENDQPEYIGVKMGFLGTSSTLIPWQLATVDEANGRIDVSVDKETAENGPAFDDDREITPEFENQVYTHYGLQRATTTEEPGAYEAYQGKTTDEDEMRVQRTEEELRAGTREREAGGVQVRKRVRIDREQMEVPTRREEVRVDRVPVEGEASEAEIGEEEVRVRKDVVEDTEVVEEDVRREEVDVDDERTGRTR
jgi:stress response protein YsnF